VRLYCDFTGWPSLKLKCSLLGGSFETVRTKVCHGHRLYLWSYSRQDSSFVVQSWRRNRLQHIYVSLGPYSSEGGRRSCMFAWNKLYYWMTQTVHMEHWFWDIYVGYIRTIGGWYVDRRFENDGLLRVCWDNLATSGLLLERYCQCRCACSTFCILHGIVNHFLNV